MNNERTKKKTPVVFYISLVLLCLCMLTSHMTGGLYARYSTTVTGTASAQVANIDVYIDYKFMGHTLDIKMQSVTEEYYAVIEEFTVENNGEVAYDYTLNLKLAKDVNSAEYDNPDDS
ncbi:MAG: hypothetical protein IJD67_05295, partial [Clostridia bacterium]|nr:hypothetical protein [Clostridia bacterium]